MKVAIIGAGNVGKALAGSIARAGHEVTLSAAHADHANDAAAATGTVAAADNRAAVRGADVVILAVPFAGVAEALAAELREALQGKTVVDATNPVAPDYSRLVTTDTSAAERFQAWLPGAHVVKGLNTLFAATQASPDRQVEAYIAGDDADAKQQVMALVDSMGFTPIDVGALSAARSLEGMAFLNISLNLANGWDWTSSWRLQR